MAKNIGLVGGFVGRFGNAVGYTNRGRQLIRVYQPKVYNPNTKRQQLTRERFKVLNAFARTASTGIGIGFNKVMAGFTRQAFIGRNMKGLFFKPQETDYNFDHLQLSDGPLPAPNRATATAGSGNQINVPISGDTNAVGYDADGTPMYVGVVVVAINENIIGGIGEVACVTTTTMGSAVSTIPSTVQISIPGSWSGSTVHVYAFFKQSAVPLNSIPASQWPWRTPFNASPTAYMGSVEII